MVQVVADNYMNAAYIMWLRELKRFSRSKSRIAGSLMQPLLFLVSFDFGLSSIFAKAGQGNYIDILGPGIIGMSIIFTSIFNGMQVIWDRQFGFLKETLAAPVPRLAIMFGRTFGGATVASVQGCFVLILTLFVGFHPVSWILVLPTILIMLFIGTLFSGLGMMVASLMRDMQGFQLVMNFLVMPLFFLSGALFPLTDVPEALRIVAAIDPLSYGIDAMRILLTNSPSIYGMPLDLAVLTGFTVLFLGLGSYFFSKIQV